MSKSFKKFHLLWKASNFHIVDLNMTLITVIFKNFFIEYNVCSNKFFYFGILCYSSAPVLLWWQNLLEIMNYVVSLEWKFENPNLHKTLVIHHHCPLQPFQWMKPYALKELNFVGTKFRRFRGLGGLPWNLIPAKFLIFSRPWNLFNWNFDSRVWNFQGVENWWNICLRRNIFRITNNLIS